ncbi:MAG: PorP/SprF family type IX secretion system membrane protein [Chitinophagales bacterium]
MNKIFTLIFALLGVLSLSAQDIHFSQYYASPLTLNPGMTGLINGDFRISANYRGQWFTIPTTFSSAPYNTYQGAIDFSLFRKKLRDNGLGVGAAFYADEAGNGSLATYAVMGSVAYHQAVDRFGRSRISLGFQGGYIQKRIFQYDLLFEQQFDGTINSFNPFLDNGEDNFNRGNFGYFDLNVGALFSSIASEKVSYYFGFAANHLTTPGENFLDQQAEKNEIDMRYTAHGGVAIKTSKYFRILPTFLYMMQTQAQQINLGSGFEYAFTDNFKGFAGAWTRVVGGVDGFQNDAVIGTIGVETYNTRIGVSYDFNTSGFRGASKSVGAFEVSLVYIHNQEEPGRIHYERFCPTF